MDHLKLTALAARMTVREKLGQLVQLTPEYFGHAPGSQLTGPAGAAPLPPEDWGLVGSVLNCTGAAAARAVQARHLGRCRHGIPLLFMADIIHGYETIFPIPLATACSFTPALAQRAARVAAAESSVSGVHVTFSPMADLVRDPRWGRVMESGGEDPLVCSRFAAAAVRGYQQPTPESPGALAACVKHFAAYGAPEGGREYNNVELSAQTLEECYLPAYRAALAAGAKLVMAAFNTLDRVPATCSQPLLRGILRGRWGFGGVLISDYNAVSELMAHGVAETGCDAAALALEAGVDIEMMSTNYLDFGEALVAQGRIPAALLDQAVLRVLELKNTLGLFEDPFHGLDEGKEKALHLCAAHRRAAFETALECPVLLKNEGQALPLDPGQPLGLAGPFAASSHVLGGWSAGKTEGVSLWQGLCARMPRGSLALAAAGELGSLLAGVRDIPPFSEAELSRAFAGCQKVVVAVGENQNDTGEGASKTDLCLSPLQQRLIHTLKAQGKTVIAVVFSGRPLVLGPVLDSCDALLQAWFLGSESGSALAELLLGRASPSGKACITFPRSVGQVPLYYAQLRTGRPETPGAAGRYTSRYIDCPSTPLFPFGFGLTYGECSLSRLALHTRGGCLLSVAVKNRGARACTETVQLYLGRASAPVARPVRELRDFCRVALEPGEEKTVAFPITQPMLRFFQNRREVFLPGRFVFMAGLSSEHTLSLTAEITQERYAALGKEPL